MDFLLIQHINNDDAVSGIHFSATGARSIRRKPSIGSSISIHSNANSTAPNSLPRVASVTQMIKRLFSREDQSRPSSQTNAEGGILLSLFVIRFLCDYAMIKTIIFQVCVLKLQAE